jgi:hypothetical protein
MIVKLLTVVKKKSQFIVMGLFLSSQVIYRKKKAETLQQKQKSFLKKVVVDRNEKILGKK